MEQESGKILYQWSFIISGLIPKQVKLKRKIWLKKGELLLEKKGDNLHAYLLVLRRFVYKHRIISGLPNNKPGAHYDGTRRTLRSNSGY